MDTEATDRRAPAKEPMVQLYARLPLRLVEQLKAQAATERRSASAQLEVLLDEIYTETTAAAQAA